MPSINDFVLEMIALDKDGFINPEKATSGYVMLHMVTELVTKSYSKPQMVGIGHCRIEGIHIIIGSYVSLQRVTDGYSQW